MEPILKEDLEINLSKYSNEELMSELKNRLDVIKKSTS
jgi:hypothetical protein